MRNDIKIATPQQIGPLQVWPLLWERLTSHQYKVAAPLDLLEFAEFEEEDGPVVDWVQVHNPTNNPILIPSGWVISKDLFQERTLISAEYIEPHSTTAINVSCVEKGRWEETETIVIRSALHLLFEGVPEGTDIPAIQKAILTTPGVKGMDDLHVWALSTTGAALSCHLVIKESSLQDSIALKEKVKQMLSTKFHIEHATIETELTEGPHHNERTDEGL